MQHTFRATRKLQPKPGETLVGSVEQARAILADLEKKIAAKSTKSTDKAVYLCARATLYSALGDPTMLEAAQDAHKFSKSANSTALVAVALHHFGRIKESLRWYEQAWKYPHEAGYEIDIGYSNALLFQPDRWLEAWPIVKNLKKRMVWSLYLPFWDGKPCKKLSVISEGGFGDIIQNCRWLSKVQEIVEDVTVYLPPYFFEFGFSNLARRQPWFPKIESLLKVPKGVPAAGFFDLPAIFDATPDEIPSYPQSWEADPARVRSFDFLRCDRSKPRVGFCWEARAMETPLCQRGIYRALTDEQATQIVRETDTRIGWFSLQKEGTVTGVPFTELKSWEDTAAVISHLDAIVSVDTAVWHLAAAMGKPTYVILSGAVDWKFGLAGKEPIQYWYPTVTLFRNDGFGMQKAVDGITQAIANGLLDGKISGVESCQTVGECSVSL